jgi:hypothetical protein
VTVLLPSAPVFDLLGISAGSVVNVVLKMVTKWIADGSAAIVTGVGATIDETTSVSFGSAFLHLYGVIRTVGGALALPFLLAATVQALVRQDTASLVRTVLVRAPIALLGSGIAIWIVEQALAVTDAISTALLADTGGGTHFSASLVGLILGTGTNFTGFLGMALALVTAFSALVLWIELVIRSSAVLCASLFIPLALAGVIWPATAHWIRRLGETLGALILAKIAMCAVLKLGVASVENPSGASGVIEGVAIIVLAAVAPFSLLRLLPFIEQGATSHFGGMAQSALRAAGARLPNPFGGRSSESDTTPLRLPIPQMESEPVDPKVFAHHYNETRNEIDAYARSREGSGGHP